MRRHAAEAAVNAPQVNLDDRIASLELAMSAQRLDNATAIKTAVHEAVAPLYGYIDDLHGALRIK